MDESDLWPEVLENLARQNLLHGFLEALSAGVHLSSDYSGLGTAEEATRCLCIAAGSSAQRSQANIAAPRLHVQRAGDLEQDCRSVLLFTSQLGELGAPQCVFGDIGERCDEGMWTRMKRDLERINSSEVLKMETDPRRFVSMCLRQLMMQELSNVSSFCYKHRRHCPLRPTKPAATAAGTTHRSSEEGASLAASGREESELDSAATPQPDSFAARLHVAGFNCYDWSMMGARRGWLGSSTPAFTQWLAERLQLQDEDLVICENTSNFDLEGMQAMVQDQFEVQSLSVSPSLFGEPLERRRLYIIMLRKGLRRWKPHVLLGEDGQRASLQEVFDRTFRRSTVMCADDKFRAPPDVVTEYIRKLAVKNNLPVKTSSGREWSCYQAITSAVRAKVVAHTEALRGQIGVDNDEADMPHAEVRKWTSNLGQHPSYMGPVCGIPAMLQATNLWLFGKRRLALPMEHLEVQGWVLYGRLDCPYRSGLLPCLRGMRDSRVKSFAGNGMHSQVVGAVVAFALAATEPTPEAQAQDRGSKLPAWSWET